MEAYAIIVNLLLLAEFTAAVTGFIYWKKVKDTPWKYFPFYLALISVSEIVSRILILNKIYILQKYFIFFLIPLEFIFFYYMLGVHIQNKLWKKIITAGGVVFLIFVYAEAITGSTVFWIHPISYTFGNLLLIIFIFAYLIGYIKDTDVPNLKYNNMFWVCLGLLIFYIGSFPYYGLVQYLEATSVFRNRYWFVQNILNCMMYVSFSLSFIFWKRA